MSVTDYKTSLGAVITVEQFSRVSSLAVRLAGIALGGRHHELLDRRLRRQGIVDPATTDALIGAAEKGEEPARERLLGLLTTGYTEFFRHPRHFEVALKKALAALDRRGEARIWSAAAATGQEPYSMAMALVEVSVESHQRVTILATDINSESLAAARRGEFCESELASLDPVRRSQFFRGEKAGRRLLAEEPRRLVEFARLNLASPEWPTIGPFDVIFCRNVLLYLQGSLRTEIVSRVATLMTNGGLLLVDPAEHLGRAASWFDSKGGGVYSLKLSCVRELEKEDRNP